MMTNMIQRIKCPHCDGCLIEKEKHYQCDNQHHFDKARQGYVNLLIVNQKKTADPGDNKEMIQSRADFLNKDIYLPISTALNQIVHKKFHATAPLHIADIGCGEGYYLRKLKAFEGIQDKLVHYYGVDISKEAIRKAAVSSKEIAWFISSVVTLPFLAASQDILISIFAPHDFAEFSRVLNEEGALIVCSPSADHLIELRELLFTTVTPIQQESMQEKASLFFSLEESYPLRFQCELASNEDIKNLLTMTPFYFKSSREQQANVLALEKLQVTVDVVFSVFKKI